ncbi:MAG: arsenate reductase [Alphaproteobacteria bacterium]
MLTVYGLKNCDTCRKALKWLDGAGIEHSFVDLRADPVDTDRIAVWEAAVGWETLLNRRGTTWRGLPESDKGGVDQSSAIALMVAHPALMKRPIFETAGDVLVGFKADTQKALAGA